jgi:predicted transposase YbfD/YdcC
MQYTPSSPLAARIPHPRLEAVLQTVTDPALEVPLPGGPLRVPWRHLPRLFATIPDPRSLQGLRYALPALLAAMLAALLTNHRSQLAAAEWLADQPPAIQTALGFRPGRIPHQSTFNRVLARVDPDYLAGALRQLFAAALPPPPARGSQAVACDGKAQRGRLPFAPLVPGTAPVHEVSLYAPAPGVVLAAAPVVGTADKAAAELNTAPALLGQLAWRGRVLTADALFCQRSICEQVVAAGGDYLLTVKANQGHLFDTLQRWFAPEPPRRYGYAPAVGDRRETATAEHTRGRLEIRYVVASADPAAVLDWPHVAQVFMVIRSWRCQGQVGQEIHWGVTSLPAGVADVARLLELRRGHWRIENSLHYIKDVTLGEDASLIHTGQGPANMSLLRDMVVSLVHAAGYERVASRLRYYGRHPEAALELCGIPLTENA